METANLNLTKENKEIYSNKSTGSPTPVAE